jgi:SAM-dependent methyltransferase
MADLDIEWLTSSIGKQVTTEVSLFSDSLIAASKLRTKYPEIDSEKIRQSIALANLQMKSSANGIPEHFLLTDDGLQQATRTKVAKYRADFVKNFFGKQRIVDLTCGLGFDSYFFAAAGHSVTAIEKDDLLSKIAKNNLAPVSVDVENLPAEDYQIPVETQLIFIDPARRDPKGAKTLFGQTKRILDPNAWSPSWNFVQELATKYKVIAKVAPGMPEELIADWDAYWISCDGELVETMLISGGSGKRIAVLLNEDKVLEIPGGNATRVAPIGDYLVIPNSALIRASSLDYLAEQFDAGLVNEHIAWLTTSSSSALSYKSPAAQVLRINESIKFNEKELAKLISKYSAGALTVMTRGVTINPEILRKKLLKKPVKGGPEIIVAIYRDDSGPISLVCSRLP